MDDGVHTPHRRGQAHRVGKLTYLRCEASVEQLGRARFRPGEPHDFMTSLFQSMRYRTADQASRASYQNSHVDHLFNFGESNKAER
jgi:hypothetical protein